MSDLPDLPRRNAGYSLVELTIASVLLAMMIFAVATLSVSGGQAQEYARRLTRVTEINQDVLDELRLDLVSSARIFGNDAEGQANLAAFDLTGCPVPLADLRMPTISTYGQLGPDLAGNEITGNTVFFTKVSWTDRFVCTSGNDYMVDVYRWVYYYLTPEEGGPDPSHAIGLNIVRLESEPLVDAAGIDRITDASDQKEVLIHLLDATPDANGETHAPAEVVWVRGQVPTDPDTFRQISSTGALSTSPGSGRSSPWMVLRAPGEVSGMLSYRHHSVASNYAPESFGVARFAIESLTGAGFPHGLEIQVIGPSAARQVLVHLVCASTHRSGHVAWSDMQISVDVRDL